MHTHTPSGTCTVCHGIRQHKKTDPLKKRRDLYFSLNKKNNTHK